MAKKKKKGPLEIKNRKATFEYQFLENFEAGIKLFGTEIKAIRQGHANLNDAYCVFIDNELYIKSLYIAEYSHGNIFNHETRRDRKLLLHKKELKKMDRRVREKGYTIVPYRLYLNERGYAKLEIALATGKKSYDKRQTIKDRESKRDLDRVKKMHR